MADDRLCGSWEEEGVACRCGSTSVSPACVVGHALELGRGLWVKVGRTAWEASLGSC